MKVILYNWAGTAKNLPKWFKHNKMYDVSLYQIIELYETGNNIMMKHLKNNEECDTLLAVDDRRFNQR